MSLKRILVISHSAGRTGAPIVLLHLLRWLRTQGAVDFEVLLRSGGELQSEFEEIAHVWGPFSQPAPRTTADKSWMMRLLRGEKVSSAGHSAPLLSALAQRNFDVIYSNTVVNGEILNHLAELNVPAICHVHELEHWMSARTPAVDLQGTLANAQEFIVVSKAVKQNLVRNHGVSDDACHVIHGFIPTSPVQLASRVDAKMEVCARFGIPRDAQIVGGCGTLDWRKGADLFVQIARLIVKTSQLPDVHFLWMGGDRDGLACAELRYDAKQAGVDQQVHFIGSQTNPMDIYPAFDVFALTSREDPYPLVMLEAAAGGTPVVGFADSGGVSEFVEDDAGIIVPYLDVGAMAQAVTRLLRDVELRAEMGDAGRRKVLQDHNVAVAGNKILNVIEDLVDTRELAISSSEVRP